jgi:hypothetical protein
MRTGSEGLSTRGRVRAEATGRRVTGFSSASMDIFLRKAEADAMMSAMMNSVTRKFRARASEICAANLPAPVAPRRRGNFSV